MKTRSLILAGLCAAGLCHLSASLACAPVPGEGRFVHVTTEEAIIIWDEGAKRQHFIRRASFDTNAKDFGFLVPTPAKPELGEADDKAFAALAEITAPQVSVAKVERARAPKSLEAPAAVTVLEQKVVAGFDAAVLEATDAKALDGWLKRNGYPSSPDLVEWYAPYIAGKWKITAFKIAGNSPKVSSAAVRMSFQTEKPFFPYREPATQRAADRKEPRLLRVYFVADGRFGGAIGESASWPGETVWSNQIETAQLATLLKLAKLPPLAGGGGRWLTEFEDRSSPRPGTDEVFFSRAADQGTLERPPVAVFAMSSSTPYMWIAAAVIALVLGAIAYTLWRLFRGFF